MIRTANTNAPPPNLRPHYARIMREALRAAARECDRTNDLQRREYSALTSLANVLSVETAQRLRRLLKE